MQSNTARKSYGQQKTKQTLENHLHFFEEDTTTRQNNLIFKWLGDVNMKSLCLVNQCPFCHHKIRLCSITLVCSSKFIAGMEYDDKKNSYHRLFSITIQGLQISRKLQFRAFSERKIKHPQHIYTCLLQRGFEKVQPNVELLSTLCPTGIFLCGREITEEDSPKIN